MRHLPIRPLTRRYLLNPYPRDRSADHQLLDLLGAFEDVEGLIWTYPLVTVGARFYPLTWGNVVPRYQLVTAGYPYSEAKVGMPDYGVLRWTSRSP